MTPEQAVQKAIQWYVEQYPMFSYPKHIRPISIKAIELYEADRSEPFTVDWYKKFEPNRVTLTPEQAKAFEERVDMLEVESEGLVTWRANRTLSGDEYILWLEDAIYNAKELRQFAAVCEAMAENLIKFSK